MTMVAQKLANSMAQYNFKLPFKRVSDYIMQIAKEVDTQFDIFTDDPSQLQFELIQYEEFRKSGFKMVEEEQKRNAEFQEGMELNLPEQE